MTFSLSTVRHAAPVCVAPRQTRLSLRLMLTVWAERRALVRMDENRLADLGLTPSQAAREAARPFWDLPNHRQ